MYRHIETWQKGILRFERGALIDEQCSRRPAVHVYWFVLAY